MFNFRDASNVGCSVGWGHDRTLHQTYGSVSVKELKRTPANYAS